MKIIGKNENGFILEASKDEVANMKNLYSSRKDDTSVIGGEILVESVYQRYYALENLIKSNDFNAALSRLKKAIKLLTPVEEVFDENSKILN